ELVHALAAQSHAAADLVAFAEPEAADRDPSLGHLGLLPGDLGQVLGGSLHPVLVLQGLADAHVDDDLLQARQAVRVLPTQLVGQAGSDFFLVAIHQAGHGANLDPGSTAVYGTARVFNLAGRIQTGV